MKDKFYEDLQSVTDTVPNYELRLIIGDLNTKAGSYNNQWTRVLCFQGVGVMSNNGLRLVEYNIQYEKWHDNWRNIPTQNYPQTHLDFPRWKHS